MGTEFIEVLGQSLKGVAVLNAELMHRKGLL